MKTLIKKMLLMVVCAPLLAGCQDDDSEPVSGDNQLTVNRFISDVMYQYYYWLKDLPETDYTKEGDPAAYFEKLRSKDDPFSYIIEDTQEYDNAQVGISKEKGWIYDVIHCDDSVSVNVVVTYVYNGSPAHLAGVQRGDIIYRVSTRTNAFNERLNIGNYNYLLELEEAKYYAWRYDKNNTCEDVKFEITDKQITKNAVSEHAVLDGNIGYILYNKFSSAFNDDLDRVAEEFKAAGVKSVILDLRYNMGGVGNALRHLCSILAPKSAVDNEDIIIWNEYNYKMVEQGMYKKEENATRFDKNVPVNLDLDKVVFITSPRTASASEAAIIGLQPYMETYCVGWNTYGKNYAMWVMRPEEFINEAGQPTYDSSINNWVISPIVSTYRNSADYTFVSSEGIWPDYRISELHFTYKGRLGTTDEPLTAAAIEYIKTGSISGSGNKTTSLSEPRIIENNEPCYFIINEHASLKNKKKQHYNTYYKRLN